MSSQRLELYHNNMSVCAQKVRLVLREKGLTPIEHHLNLRAGDATTPEYLRLNPNGVVPTLVDDGEPIIESSIICEYLEEICPEPALLPQAPLQRAAVRWWTLRPDAGLHAACGATTFAIAFRHQMLAMPAAQREALLAAKPDPIMRDTMRMTIELGVKAPQAIAAIHTLKRHLDMMTARLEQSRWLGGEAYTLADIAMLPYVVRMEHLSMSWLWQKQPVIDDWLLRCKQRPNFSAIHDYLDEHYLQLMQNHGQQENAALQTILAG